MDMSRGLCRARSAARRGAVHRQSLARVATRAPRPSWLPSTAARRAGQNKAAALRGAQLAMLVGISPHPYHGRPSSSWGIGCEEQITDRVNSSQPILINQAWASRAGWVLGRNATADVRPVPYYWRTDSAPLIVSVTETREMPPTNSPIVGRMSRSMLTVPSWPKIITQPTMSQPRGDVDVRMRNATYAAVNPRSVILRRTCLPCQ